jgi:hypothetical protein
MRFANTPNADSNDGTCGEDGMTDLNQSSVQLLHLVTAIDERRGMLGFCCETQPLATVRSYGCPKRCPFCQQENPVTTDFSTKKNGEKL